MPIARGLGPEALPGRVVRIPRPLGAQQRLQAGIPSSFAGRTDTCATPGQPAFRWDDAVATSRVLAGVCLCV